MSHFVDCRLLFQKSKCTKFPLDEKIVMFISGSGLGLFTGETPKRQSLTRTCD